MIVKAPGMIEALQNVGMSLIVPANERSSVRARVQENPQPAVVAADEEKRPSRYIAAPVVARVLYFGFVAQIEPAFVEYPLLLHLKNLERCHSGTMDAEYTVRRLIYDHTIKL
ncbi:MAG TPA: hypothetical protein VFO36_05890 [Nitrospiraceae bacterium]|nr:hypothetical protein [Nitrospiraceae bacterium]